jgi:hypothetical protein
MLRAMHSPRAHVAAMALLISGCYSTYVIRPGELKHLDGYDVHNEGSAVVVTGAYSATGRPGSATPTYSTVPVTDRPYRMIDEDGDARDFNSTTELFIGTPQGKIGGKWWNIRVSEEALSGQLKTGENVKVPLAQVATVELNQFSGTKTMLAILLGSTPLAIIALALALSL